jgi:uncharacterized protein DUF992
MRRGLIGGLMVVMLVGLVSLAQAGEEKKGVKVGTLRCNEASGWGFVFGSSFDLKCVFNSAEKGEKPMRYTGKIKKFGVDIGYQGNAVILWAVASTSEKFMPGDLAGTYGGVTGEAAWAVGLGANLLYGGSKKGFALQPLSVEGVAGANVAAGVAVIELKQAK